MTYMTSRRRHRGAAPRARAAGARPGRPGRGPGLGIDFWDVASVINPLVLITRVEADIIVDAMTKNVAVECWNAGDNELAPVDSRILELRAWNTNGFYQASDVRDIVNSIVAVAIAADEQIAQAPRSTGDAESTIAQVRTGIKRKIEASQVYLKTASEALFQGIPVDAPSLKDWAISTLRSARQGMAATYFLQCSVTWLERALGFVMRILDAAWSFIQGVVNVAVAIGEQVAKVPDFASSLITYAKYGLVGYAAYRLIKYAQEQR